MFSGRKNNFGKNINLGRKVWLREITLEKREFLGFSGVTTLLGYPKGPVELGNPNTCAEVKLCFFFMPTLEIVCRETKVFF